MPENFQTFSPIIYNRRLIPANIWFVKLKNPATVRRKTEAIRGPRNNPEKITMIVEIIEVKIKL